MSKPEHPLTEAEEGAEAWVGRTDTRTGCLTPNLAGMLDAAVAHRRSVARDLSPGAPMPRLWHWAAFPEFVPHAELGPDGHPKLGGFLPPLRFSRRMWAAGALRFKGVFHVGETLERRSEILAVTEKDGSTGKMAFVKLGHVIEGERGGRIEEEQDIVYLNIPDRFRPPKRLPAPEAPDFVEPVAMDEARLFRFSAATYNAHRIHYDLPYAREVERYPGLVVHGPMQAILLAEAAERHTGRAPQSFKFRGVHPMLLGEGIRLVGQRADEGGAIALSTVADADYICLQAKAEWTP